MKVKELVKFLEGVNEDSEVIYDYEKDVGWFSIDGISLIEDSATEFTAVNLITNE